MKSNQLSNFQKEQYTQYLQTQLQNFSSFMLSQKKQNQKYRLWENVIVNQNQKIKQLENKFNLLNTYQDQNYKETQRIRESTILKFQSIENRLKRLQSVYCSAGLFDKQNNQKIEEQSVQRLNQLQNSIVGQIMSVQKALDKKIKRLENDIIDCRKNNIGRNTPSTTIHTQMKTISERDNDHYFEKGDFASKKDLKKVQKKLHEFFMQKFQKIEKVVNKSVKKSLKNFNYVNNQDELSNKENISTNVNVVSNRSDKQRAKQRQKINKQNQRKVIKQLSNNYNQYEENQFYEKSFTPSQNNTSFNQMGLLQSKIESYFDNHKSKIKKTKKNKKKQNSHSHSRSKSKSVSQTKSKNSKLRQNSFSQSRSVGKSQKSVSKSQKNLKEKLSKNQHYHKKDKLMNFKANIKQKSRKSLSPANKQKSKEKSSCSALNCVNQYKKSCKKRHF